MSVLDVAAWCVSTLRIEMCSCSSLAKLCSAHVARPVVFNVVYLYSRVSRRSGNVVCIGDEFCKVGV